MKNVLEYLEASAAAAPHATAIIELPETHTDYATLWEISRRIGSALLADGAQRGAVVVLMDKSAAAVEAFFGVVYAGQTYVPLSPALPPERLRRILSVTGARRLITDSAHWELACSLLPREAVLPVERLAKTPVDGQALDAVRARMIDTDPLYANFTSGSTGVPKGVLISHRSVIDFIDRFVPLFGIDRSDRLANQAPLDFDVSVKDIYAAMKTGAALVLIPQSLFSQPTALLDALCEQEVTTLIWAVSALCLVTTFHGLDYRVPHTVRRVLFSGEVMPEKHLRQWMDALPNAQFVNLYGPTEITCNCTWHRVERGRAYPDGLPIGRPFDNERVFLLDEAEREVTQPGQTGEICVSGTALALGYVGDPEETARRFPTNPLSPLGGERIYRTGDLGFYNPQGELVFAGRRDFQVKHMGHRIELEEIERALMREPGVERACCVFDPQKARLTAFYVGTAAPAVLREALAAQLPVFMLPRRLTALPALPMTDHGKIDRKELLRLAGTPVQRTEPQ